MAWKTIVVGYTRDHASAVALQRAAQIAKAGGGTLIVTSIAPLMPTASAGRGVGPYDPADPPEAHRADLEHARELLEPTHVTAEFDLEVGHPADAIVALATRREADLIVVGSHERSFVDRLLHGSVSDAVSRRAHCDVLIVH
jgi:nucleotide-binding universal stress UspA family protein